MNYVRTREVPGFPGFSADTEGTKTYYLRYYLLLVRVEFKLGPEPVLGPLAFKTRLNN